MKIAVKDLKFAMETLQWKVGWERDESFDNATMELESSEEDVGKGILCATIKVSISYETNKGKQITKTIEMYPKDENREPVVTKTERWSMVGKNLED